MRGVRLAAVLIAGILTSPFGPMAAGPRPHLGSGACLSCHFSQLPTLPAAPCISCHSANMDFLSGHERSGQGFALWTIGAAGGGGVLALAVICLAGVRRLPAAGALLALAVMAGPVPEKGGPYRPPVAGAVRVALGFACDLSPVLSPDGEAILFSRRGPDTSGDGKVDLRDGMALFLLHKTWERPLRLTPYTLDAQGSMATWSPDGARFAAPVAGGLALWDGSGKKLAEIPARAEEVFSPSFSPDGNRIAFVDGTGIGLWEISTGLTAWALEPLSGGEFPRLAGWSPWDDGVLFTRGKDYTRMGRDSERRLVFPAEVPLESAVQGLARVLTLPGPAPLRRYRPQAVSGGVFYLAKGPDGAQGLYLFDGRTERRWSAPGQNVSPFVACGTQECWTWIGAGPGRSRLARFSGPGSAATMGPVMKASLLVMAADGSGRPWVSGAAAGRQGRGLYHVGQPPEDDAAPGSEVFGLSSSNGTLAVVVVRGDGDGDGELTPYDRGELWVAWRTP